MSLAVVQWVFFQSTTSQAPSSITAGFFIFMNSGTFKKLIFPPKSEIFAKNPYLKVIQKNGLVVRTFLRGVEDP